MMSDYVALYRIFGSNLRAECMKVATLRRVETLLLDDGEIGSICGTHLIVF